MTQSLIVIAILLGATVYVGRKVWQSIASVRKAKNAPGCGPGCGCE